MNKTIKQAERYEAPNINALAISLRECVLQTSVTDTPGGTGHGFEEEIID